MSPETLRESLTRVGWPFLASRLGLFAWAWWTCLHFEGGRWRMLPEWPWLDAWVRWDSGWYLQIAESGYYLDPSKMSTAAFFPLYPLTSWLASAPLRFWFSDREAVLIAGILISHLGFWLGLAGVRQLMLLRTDAPAAKRAIWLICLFPFSYIFGAFYTEGLYFALTVWGFVLMERGRDATACGLLALAISCRVQGLFVALGLASELLIRRRSLAPILLIGVASLGVATFFAQEVGNPLAMVEAQRPFRGGESSLGMLRELTRLEADWFTVRMANLTCLLLTMTAVPGILRRFGPGYALATFLSLLVPAWTSLNSLGRYSSVVFPVFMLAADLTRWRVLYLATLALFTVGLVYLSQQFFTWGPAF